MMRILLRVEGVALRFGNSKADVDDGDNSDHHNMNATRIPHQNALSISSCPLIAPLFFFFCYFAVEMFIWQLLLLSIQQCRFDPILVFPRPFMSISKNASLILVRKRGRGNWKPLRNSLLHISRS
jgi:hypothetical protein